MQAIKHTVSDFAPVIGAYAVIFAGGVSLAHNAGGFRVLFHAARVWGF